MALCARLNWMSGRCDEAGVCRAPAAAAPVRQEIYERVLNAVLSWSAPERGRSQEEAARALLSAEPACDFKARVTVAPFEEGMVSMPENVRDARCADLIGGADARAFARDVHRT